MARIEKKRCAIDKSLFFYQKALSIDRKNGALFLELALICPPIMTSIEEVKNIRSTIKKQLQSVNKNASKLQIKNPNDLVYLNFYSVYHGLNDCDVNTKMMDLLLKIYPRLGFQAQHTKKIPQKNKKIKIGFLSAYLRHHTIGRLFSSLLMKLSDEYFEKILIIPQEDSDDLTAELKQHCSKNLYISRDVLLSQIQIQNEELDILFFPEIGMDSFIHLLSLSRLAHLQIVTWGHPVTTGSPNVDYFLLPEGMYTKTETFREKILTTPTPNIYYKPISASEQNLFSEKYTVPKGNLYACPQTLYKFHPDFISVFKGIIEKDPNAIFVLSQASAQYWAIQLIEQWKKHIPEIEKHIYWAPKIRRHEFIDLLGLCDVMLDPFPYGGGNTILEAFSVNLPVVTLATPYARCRITKMFLKEMDIPSLIATDINHYVDLSVQIATKKQNLYPNLIAQKKHILFENMQYVKDFQTTIIHKWLSLTEKNNT